MRGILSHPSGLLVSLFEYFYIVVSWCFFTVLGAEPEHAAKALQEKAGYLHSLLFKRLHIHTVPTLHFHYDSSVEHGIEMSRLIDQAVDSDRKDEAQ